MEPPELTNFGSLVRFAVELETSTAAFYETAAASLPPGAQADLARALATQHENRRALLLRTRQQKLNEMVLEPITGLDGRRYLFDATRAGPDSVISKAVALEETAQRLYEESSVVARSLLTEAARTLRKLADENGSNLTALRGLSQE